MTVVSALGQEIHKTDIHAFVQLFCPACKWAITAESGKIIHCDNPKCSERATAYEVQVKVVKVEPVNDFRRPERP
jgi:hypothetical protein